MSKEIENLQELETRRDSLSKGIGRINDVYLSDPVRIGKVEVGSSFSTTLEVGRTKAAAKKAIVGLGNRLEQVNNELSVNDEARVYLHRVNQMEQGLDEMRELVAEGNLPEDLLRQHQQEFDELQKLPENNPSLQRAIQRIRQQEEKKKEEQPSGPVQPEEVKDTTDEGFRFEDVRVVTGDEGKILRKLSPFDPHHIVSREELMRELSNSETAIGQQAFDQHLREVVDILDWRRYRLEELPNPKDPDNKDENGYYVETVRRQQVNMTLLGDTVRYTDRQNQTKEVRLSEPQYRLLWQLSSGEPKIARELYEKIFDKAFNDQEDPNFFLRETIASLAIDNAVSGLNKNLADLTGVEEIVTSLGDISFGNWHKIKDARIARRFGYWPVQPTRQDALKLIFQDNPATTKEEIIRTLGPTRGVKRASRLLLEHQATMALRNAIRGLKNRNLQNIATEDEAALYQQMQEYIAEHNLTDERDLTRYIVENKLGIIRTASPSTTEEPDSIRDIDVGDVEREIQDEERDSGLARMTREEEIETPEFGSLSKADVALMAERLEFNRDRLEPFLGERGVRLIEEDVLFELMGLTEGQEIGAQEAYHEGRLSEEEFNQLMSDYRARAFEKAREIIKDPDLDSILERIGDKNPHVWSLLVNLSEVNDVIEKSGHEEGISLIGKDPESLAAIFSQSQVPPEFITNEATPSPQPTTVFEAPLGVGGAVVGIKPVEPKLSALERRDPEIIATINQYLDEILAVPELNGPVSPSIVTRFFPRIKTGITDQCVEEGWVRGIPSQSNRRTSDQVRFGPDGIATLRYLYENENLPSRLKKRVQDIARKEFDKRKDGKGNQ